MTISNRESNGQEDKMLVKELIEKLKEMNPEQPVFISAEFKSAHLAYWDVPILDVQQTNEVVTLFIAN